MDITYIYHSSFLVELQEYILLFDYYEGELPPLNPKKHLLVFVSHNTMITIHHVYGSYINFTLMCLIS